MLIISGCSDDKNAINILSVEDKTFNENTELKLNRAYKLLLSDSDENKFESYILYNELKNSADITNMNLSNINAVETALCYLKSNLNLDQIDTSEVLFIEKDCLKLKNSLYKTKFDNNMIDDAHLLLGFSYFAAHEVDLSLQEFKKVKDLANFGNFLKIQTINDYYSMLAYLSFINNDMEDFNNFYNLAVYLSMKGNSEMYPIITQIKKRYID